MKYIFDQYKIDLVWNWIENKNQMRPFLTMRYLNKKFSHMQLLCIYMYLACVHQLLCICEKRHFGVFFLTNEISSMNEFYTYSCESAFFNASWKQNVLCGKGHLALLILIKIKVHLIQKNTCFKVFKLYNIWQWKCCLNIFEKCKFKVLS